ncbi:hypothetical protein ACTA71_002652 [Dictyostelium dimigraforme]
MYFYCVNQNKEYQENDRLFFKIWRNKSIRNQILYQLKVSNNHISRRIFTLGDLLDGKFRSNEFKDYFKNLLIKNSFKETEINNNQSQMLTFEIIKQQLPPSVDTLQILPFQEKQQLPFKISYLPETITNLKLYSNKNNSILNEDTFDMVNRNLKSLHLQVPDIQWYYDDIDDGNDYYNEENKNGNRIIKSPPPPQQQQQVILKSSMFLGLTSLNISIKFNNEILPNVLPQTLNKLILSPNFNKALQVGSLPQSLTHLEFGRDFNQPLQPIQVLPTQLKYLYFGQSFNQSIDNLPISNLQVLEFSFFNRLSTKLKLPPLQFLESLKFGSKYQYKNIFNKININNNNNNNNKIINNSIKKLRVGEKLNIKYLKMLSNLTNLDMASVIKIETNSLTSNQTLPSTIKKLKINLGSGHLKSIKLPKSVEKLILIIDSSTKYSSNLNSGGGGGGGGILPNHLTSLDFRITSSNNISFNPETLFQGLTNLKSITFNNYCHSLSKISNNYNLPSNLLKLVQLNEMHGQDEETVFPKSVEILNFELLTSEIKPLVSFPPNLKSLKILNYKEQEVVIPKLPDSIKLLELPIKLSQDISSTWLPSSLETLILNGNPKIKDLPNTLKTLYIDDSNSSILYNQQLFNQLLPIIKVCNFKTLNLFKTQSNKK